MSSLSVRVIGALVAFAATFGVKAACIDNVVLVHGNAGKPADFNNTYNELRARGWAANQIFRPDWEFIWGQGFTIRISVGSSAYAIAGLPGARRAGQLSGSHPESSQGLFYYTAALTP